MGVLVNTENSTVNLSNQGVSSDFESLSYSVGIELYGSGTETNTESDGEEIDLDLCLAVESFEKRKINAEMDILDKVIEEERKAAEIRQGQSDDRIKVFQNIIKQNEVRSNASKLRADILIKMELEEIKSQAEKSLKYIEEIETMKIVSHRKQLYFGTAGEQQSLLYKQIWGPFTDDQHEVAMNVVTAWHKSRGEEDRHYIWNVTLPELCLHMYKEIFNISTIAESEMCIFSWSSDE